MKFFQKILIILGIIALISAGVYFFFFFVGKENTVRLNEYTSLEKIGKDTYSATISSNINVVSDELIENPKWDQNGEAYIANNDIFSVTVNDEDTTVKALQDIEEKIEKGQDSNWSPQIFLNDKEIDPISNTPILLEIDPFNGNYKNNVLEWDYGICKRYLRLTEWSIFDLYVFEENPNGDIVIKSNSSGDLNPDDYYAVGKNRRPLIGFTIEEDRKILNKDSFDNVEFPVEVDDSFSADTTDGFLAVFNNSYSTARNLSSANYKDNYSADMRIGQSTWWWEGGKEYEINRGYIYFDTRSLPSNATINSAYLRLFVPQISFYNTSVTNFDLTVQFDQSHTHPMIPLQYLDFYKRYYSGNGGSLNTNNMRAGSYNNINLNSTGLGWITKEGYSKFTLRSSRDINGNAPTMAPSFGLQSQELIRVGTAQAYSNKRPTLVVNFTVPAPIMTISQSSLDFADTYEGEYRDMNFSVSNIGSATLIGNVSGLAAPFSCISNCSNFSINSGQSENVTVRFSPISEGSFNDTAIFTTNGGNMNKSVSGNGLMRGCIPTNTIDVDYTISSANLGGETTCIIESGNTEGVENGDIIISSGITIQMNSDTELIFNQGKSIFNQGIIAKGANNSVIRKGNLGSTCSDACSLGQTSIQCLGNYTQSRTCGDYDSDSCLEWSSWSNVTNCDASDGCSGTTYADYYCSGGSCTYTSSYNDSRCVAACTNDCSYSGQTKTQCSGSYTQSSTCGDYDSDSCLEWSSWSNVTNCDASDGCSGETYRDYYCSGGSCTYSSSYNDSRCITCTNDCSYSGQTATQCSGSYTQSRTCGDYDSDSCLEWSSWSNVTNCDASDGCSGNSYLNYYCSGGSCTYSSTNCGTDRCSGTTWIDYYCSGSSCGSTNYYNDSRCIPDPAAGLQNCSVGPGTLIGSSTGNPPYSIAQTGDLLVRAANGYVWCSCNGRAYAMYCKVGTNCVAIDCSNNILTETWTNGNFWSLGQYTGIEKSEFCIVDKANAGTPIIVNHVPSCTDSSLSSEDRGNIFIRNNQCSWSSDTCSITGTDNCYDIPGWGNPFCGTSNYLYSTQNYGYGFGPSIDPYGDTCVKR